MIPWLWDDDDDDDDDGGGGGDDNEAWCIDLHGPCGVHAVLALPAALLRSWSAYKWSANPAYDMDQASTVVGYRLQKPPIVPNSLSNLMYLF